MGTHHPRNDPGGQKKPRCRNAPWRKDTERPLPVYRRTPRRYFVGMTTMGQSKHRVRCLSTGFLGTPAVYIRKGSVSRKRGSWLLRTCKAFSLFSYICDRFSADALRLDARSTSHKVSNEHDRMKRFHPCPLPDLHTAGGAGGYNSLHPATQGHFPQIRTRSVR